MLIYKIVPTHLWRDAEPAGVFTGAPVDHADGYIHFSSAAQVAETAARHFAGATDLSLVVVDAEKLAPSLKWEASRGGDDFPHLYASLDFKAVVSVHPLKLGADGLHEFTGLLV